MTMEIPAAGGGVPAVLLATQGAVRAPPPHAEEAAAPRVMPLPRAEIRVNTEQKQREVTAAVSTLNEHMRDGGRGLNFAVDKTLGGPVVTVTNKDTGEVIRQIPSEAAVQMAHSLEQLKGFLLNAKT